MATTARYKRIQLTPIYIIAAKAASSATVATKLTAVTLRIKHEPYYFSIRDSDTRHEVLFASCTASLAENSRRLA